jgi:hypothetical protein
MTPLVIILLIIGAGILIFSCFLVEKDNTEVYSGVALQQELNLTELDGIKNKVAAVISELSEEAVLKTEDRLSQISNEKIIAVNDFSNQVLEKISQNHEEVVFLYNMLNEKETEIKETVKSFDKIKKQVNDTAKSAPQTETRRVAADSNNKKTVTGFSSESGSVNLDSEQMNNNNQKILELYSQGFSVIDISRTLELGQGEVKLVIDLFKEK